MKESLRILLPGFVWKLLAIEILYVKFNFRQTTLRLLNRLAILFPAEVIMTFIGIKLIAISYEYTTWIPYSGTALVLLLRYLSNNLHAEERPFDIGGFMVFISVLAYTAWSSAIAVFFFLCTLLLMTLGW